MSDLRQRIADLPPEKRALLESRLLLRSGSVSSEPTISRRRTTDPCPVSFAQQRLWFLDQLEPGRPVYNLSQAVRLSGAVELEALQKALDAIVARHEALRTTFASVDGNPVQVVAGSGSVPLKLIDVSGRMAAAGPDEIGRFLREEADRPFNLSRDVMLRAMLLRESKREHVLLLTMHHIASDGWSVGVLLRDLAALYEAFCWGKPSPLAELPIQYSDYAVWQREWFQGEVLESQLSYWKQHLSGAPAVLELPTDRPRPAVQTFRGTSQSVVFPVNLLEALNALSRQEGVTLFMTLLAAFQTLLFRYAGQEDILVGSPIAGRTQVETEGLIGFFVNTLVLRGDLSGDPTFRELLGRVREVALGAYAHQDLPFERLVNEFKPERTLSHTPLVQVMFVFDNAPASNWALGGLSVNLMELETRSAKFDLTLSVEDAEQGLRARLEYNTDLFDGSTAGRMLGHFEVLLAAIVADPGRRLSDLPLLTQAERHQLLMGWNDTKADYPRDRCVHELFEAQVERSPEAVAVVFEGEQLTYRDLNCRANQLAHYMRGLGVGPEALVGLCVERSLEMVVGLLGVLKAGGAYVPLDPTYPKERLAFMLEDTGAAVVLTQQRLVEALPAASGKVIRLDADWGAIARESEENPASEVTAENLAYVIYTSGSTGKPKGTMILHRSVVNYLNWCTQAYEVAAGQGAPIQSSLSFDLTVTGLYAPLLVGRQVHLFPEGHAIETLGALFRTGTDFSLVKITPAHLDLLRQQLSPKEAAGRTRAFVIGGENLPAESLAFWQDFAPDTALFNEYGPTETVVGCSVYKVPNGRPNSGSVPIGRPIANTQLFILGPALEPVPIGVRGELYIGGAGLARGYLNLPKLTAEKFIPSPFSEEPGACLYKTGDLARCLPDGNVEFLGRMDYQVKIRGFRVELGEIEAVLGQHPAVRRAAVVLREEVPGDKRLVAYLVCDPRHGSRVGELRGFLKSKLPEYMVPSAFVLLDALPLTPNGKVDRRALPVPDRSRPELERAFVAPRTPVEEMLAGIWAQVLGLQRVGIHDNFFELGGDSILGIQIIARATRAGLRLNPKQLFQHQTVAELAAVAGTTRTIQVDQGVVTGPVPLTPIQHWFFEQDLLDPHHYNQAILLEVRQPLDPALLEQVAQQLVAHHDALRLRFLRDGSGWQQVNAGVDQNPVFSRLDLTALSETDQGPAIEAAAAKLQGSLNLSEGPLARVALFHRGSERPSRLLIVIQHLAVDGISWRVLLEDLQTVYEQLRRGEAIELPPKTTSFKEWAERLADHARSAALEQELSYWLAERWTQIHALPVDYPGRANSVASARTVSVSLSKEETTALLQEVPAAYRTQINDALLTALLQAFSAWTGVRSLLIDLEGHGREEIVEDVDLSRTVGWFTSRYPVLLELGESGDPGDALKAIKEQLRAIPQRGIGYGLLRYLSPDSEVATELRALPQPEVSFNYLGQFDQVFPEGSVFSLARDSTGPTRSLRGSRRYLLTIDGKILGGQLQFSWTYSGNLYQHATIERLANGFVEALRSLMGLPPRVFFELPTVAGLATRIEGGRLAAEGLEPPPLVPVSRDRELPLSFGQQRLWFLDQLEPGSCAYNVHRALRMRGVLNIGAVQQSVNEIVQRHEVLRTRFVAADGRPVQVIADADPVETPVMDLSGLSESERETEARRLATDESERPFDLTRGPLIRVRLFRLAREEHLLLVTMHHIVSDRWSLGIFFHELGVLYSSFAAGEASPLSELHIQYADYAAWQRGWLRGEILEKLLAYWRAQLAGIPPPLELPADRKSPAVRSFSGARHVMELPVSLSLKLKDLSRQERVTLFMTFLAAFQGLLSHYTGRKDIVVGTDIAGRSHVETESLIGFFVNLLVIRTDISGRPTFRELVRRVREVALSAYAHQDVPFEKLVEEFQPERSLGRNPLVQVLIVMQNQPIQRPTFPGLTLTPFETDREASRFDLVLFLAEREERLAGTWLYSTDVFDAGTIARMATDYETVLRTVVEQPDIRLDQMEWRTEAEKVERAMDKRERQESQLAKLRITRRQSVDFSRLREIKTDCLSPGETLPLVVVPAVEDVDLVEWALRDREFIHTNLLRHGALLFRGFNVSSPEQFEQFALTGCPELFGEYGDLPREEVGGKVYGSTPYPSDQAILFHNESSHMHRWPMKIWFYCMKAAEKGGETPIVDCRKVYQRLSDSIRERFEQKQLMYVRNYTDGLDVSWQTFFRTSDRSAVEEYCRKASTACEWTQSGLRTRHVCPAVLRHPQTGEMVFFNQLQLHHVSCLDPAVRESMLSLLKEEDLPRNVYYGDGTPIEDSVVDEVREVYREAAVSFPWLEGDILMLNNMLTAHGRNPYSGPRKIVVAMGEMINKDEISS